MTDQTIPDIPDKIKPVNREEQVAEFRSSLERVRVLGSVFQTLFEWHGSPGIGKSVLIRLLRDVCEENGAPFSFVDFSPARNQRATQYAQDLGLMLEDLLALFPEDRTRETRDAITYFRTGEEPNLDEAARAFQRMVIRLTAGGPVALFFDETEQADQETVAAWLEEWIIHPLVQQGRCLIVWCGRRPQRWKRYEVRRRARVEELGVFDEESTKKLLQKNSSYPMGDLAKPVRKLTGGHPLAETIVIRYLDYMAREGRKPLEAQFGEYEMALLDALVLNFVDSFAFKNMDETVVSACRVMSLVRQFDVIMLREILTHALPETFGGYERADFGNLLSRMRATPLVLWDDRRKGYALDQTLRLIIGEHIRRHNPEFYVKINSYAIVVYQDWIRRAGENRGIYIVEELFQQASLNRAVGRKGAVVYKDLEDVLRQRIDEYEQNDPDLRASALDRLFHELENDPDLPVLSGSKRRDQLLEIARAARASVVDVPS